MLSTLAGMSLGLRKVEAIIIKEAESPEDFNMGSSSSSQYTFCQPEIVT